MTRRIIALLRPSRAGDVGLAHDLFAGESWREFAPAALFRLATIHETTDRPGETLKTHRTFLSLWSGADPRLPPSKPHTTPFEGWAAETAGEFP